MGVLAAIGRLVLGVMLALWLAVMAAPLHATVLDEAALPGGFSGEFATPTPVPTGTIGVVGTGEANDHDFLVFTALEPGAQTLRITLSRNSGAGPGQNSGGEVFFKTSPFLHGWDGSSAGRFRLNQGHNSHTLSITLDAGFAGGELHVGLYFTHGHPITYRIEAPGNTAPPPSPPPIPPGDTMQPGDAPGGAYSNNWRNPTPVGPGYAGVEGTGGWPNSLYFVFTDLPDGIQTLEFEFSYPEGVAPIYWAGGTVIAREAPFRWAWDGTRVGDFQINPIQRTMTLSMTTGAGFQGTLYVGLLFTYGSQVGFRINVPSNVPDPGGLPEVEAAKTVRVIDQFGGACATIGVGPAAGAQAAIPGACIEYVIEARNGGTGPATELAIEDRMGRHLIFVAAEVLGFDGPASTPDISLPARNTDCATGGCLVQLRDGHLGAGERGRIVIRGLLK